MSKLDMEAIKRRHAYKSAQLVLMGVRDQTHEDRRDLMAEVERLTAKIRDLRLWAISKSATMSTWSSEDWQKFPLASDEYGPYCPVCQAGPGRIHKEHRAGCEWMLLFQGTL